MLGRAVGLSGAVACALASTTPLAAQVEGTADLAQKRTSVQDALTDWARGDERSRGVVRRVLLSHQAHSDARVDSALTGVERLILDASREGVRSSAANMLLSAGSSMVAPQPLPGIIARVRSSYAASTDPVVRILIVRRMQEQAERTEAIEFLKDVVIEGDPLTTGFDHSAVHFAIGVLNRMEPHGQTALRQLYEEGTIREAGALEYLEHLGIIPRRRDPD